MAVVKKAKKPIAKKTTPKASKKPIGRGRSSEPTSRAKPAAKAALKPKDHKLDTTQAAPALKHIGRPKDSPDVWTPEHIAEVADAFWAYIQSASCPSLAEFCSISLVRFQRFSEFPELSSLKEHLFAKRAAYLDRAGLTLEQGEGPRGSYIAKAIANVGPFSLVDKSEFSGKIEGGGSRAAEMSPKERAEYLKERGWKRQ